MATTPLVHLIALLYTCASSDERSQANEGIETWINDPNAIDSLIASIDAASNEVVLFGVMAIIDRWISRYFRYLPVLTQNQIRNRLLNLMLTHSKVFSKQILIKYARIMATLASYQFPQLWPEFISQILQMISSDLEVLVYSSVLILTNLLEDCINSDLNCQLSSIQRQEILTALQTQLTPLLQLSFQVISKYHSNDQSSFGFAICKGIFKMYLPLIDFVKPEALSHPPHDVASLTLQLLESPLYYTEALDLLTAIASHKLPLALFQLLQSRIPHVNYMQSKDPLQSLLQLRALSDAIHSLLSINIFEDYISSSTNSLIINSDLLPLLINVFSFLLTLLQQLPSRRMTLSSLSHFNRILKAEPIYSIHKIEDYLLTYFDLIALRLSRAQCDNDDQPVNLIDQLEFEEREELTEVFGLIRTKARELAKILVVKYPVGMARVVERRLSAVLSVDVMSSMEYTENNECSINSTAYIEFEGFAYLTMMIFKEMESLQHLPLVVQLAENMASRLIDFDTSHILLLNEKLIALEYLSLVLPKPSLQELLAHLFACLGNKQLLGLNNRLSATLSAIASHTRQRIIESHLIVWCCTLAQSALDSGLLAHSDNTHLTELILTLSSGIASADQRMQILQSAVGSRVSYLTSEQVNSILVSPQTLLSACRSQDNHRNHITDLRNVLDSIYSIAKKTSFPDLPNKYWLMSQDIAIRKEELMASFPFAVVWDAILDRLVMILQCLHSIYHPRFRIECIQNGYSSLYLHPSLLTNEDCPLVDKECIERLESLRLLTYQLLGQACLHQMLPIHTSSFHSLVQELQHSLTYMENHHLVRLIKHFIEPLLIHTLPAFYQSISPLVQIVINNLCTRLTLATCRDAPVFSSEEDKFYWFLYVECGISTRKDLPSEVQEVHRNDILYSLSRMTVDMLSACFGMRGLLAVSPTTIPQDDSSESSKPSTSSSKANNKSKVKMEEANKPSDGNNNLSEELKKARIQKLEDLLLSVNYSLWEPTLSSLLVMLNFQDAYTCRKTIAVCYN